ncbi:MAG TPA: type II toxin-antitoxin system HigB family toxin [Chthoniobacterales bacterium]|jgi:mRNA interferase HigB|nr:type II toxin-antitoxin system HigB family toxin [Chthoniobacterales bacterium]
MNIIKVIRLGEFAERYSRASASLKNWRTVTRAAKWESFQDVKATFNTADNVPVASGRAVVVFNIAGNKFRLITAIHYNLKKVFVLRFLTHAEYSKGKWKEEL